MNLQKLAAVILAAGKGTRMKSNLAKVLHPLAGQPMALYPARVAQQLGCEKRVMVIGHQAQEVEAALGEKGLEFVLQAEQLGTGHALLCAEEALQDFVGDLLLLCGDVPLIRQQTLEKLLHYHRAEQAAVTVLTAEMTDPHGYGRIVRDGEEVLRIVEEKDASQKEKIIREINTGLYIFSAPFVFEALRDVGRDNAQNEYYLTDVLAAARAAGRKVRALSVTDPEEAMGVNDRAQLATAGKHLRVRINHDHMLAGVSLIDPMTTFIDIDVKIAPDTVIHPNVHLRGTTRIGSSCTIEPGAVITDCELGDRVHVKPGTVMAEAVAGNGCAVGPMAHLRPGTRLAGNNKLGNFVETKKAVFAEKAQASHLTYIGDAEVGRNVNIGCGTITCNYDGVNKHKTIIEDDVFVGSDTQFVAPVRIGRGSLIGAGSTITRDVPPEALALSRAEQKIIEGWVARKRGKKNQDKD